MPWITVTVRRPRHCASVKMYMGQVLEWWKRFCELGSAVEGGVGLVTEEPESLILPPLPPAK